MIRRAAVTLALALGVLGCGDVDQPPPEQVPIPVDGTIAPFPDDRSCVLTYRVVDVIADPATGTPINVRSGEPLHWPRGFTAWRAGTQVVVLDAQGRVVLTTGGRYSMCPRKNHPEWVIGDLAPCPFGEPGGGLIGGGDPCPRGLRSVPIPFRLA